MDIIDWFLPVPYYKEGWPMPATELELEFLAIVQSMLHRGKTKEEIVAAFEAAEEKLLAPAE